MIKDKVSIIIPMYNAEKYISQTVKSVIAQTYKNWELLIINDNSKDDSYKIVRELSEKDDRIKVINSEKNIGVVNGRNKLITIADGQYIAFLDADDYWTENKLDTRISEEGKPINEIKIKEEILYNDLLKNNYLGCLTVILDSEKLGKRFFKQRNKNEDYVLWLEIIKETGKIYGLKENLAFYRVLNNSRSSNKIDAAKVRWEIYRKVEKLSFFKALYYFINYAIIALKKTK